MVGQSPDPGADSCVLFFVFPGPRVWSCLQLYIRVFWSPDPGVIESSTDTYFTGPQVLEFLRAVFINLHVRVLHVLKLLRALLLSLSN
jgi:hypothetical protein